MAHPTEAVLPGDEEADTPPSVGPAPPRAVAALRRWDSVWRPAGIYIVSRLATLFAAAIAADLHPTYGLGGVLTRSWDSGWYLSVAENGYPAVVPEEAGHAVQSTIGFFPLYPLLVRFGHALGLSYGAAGLVVTAISGLAACVVLWHLVRHLSGSATADRAVALFCFFPGALMLSLPYSEALMLALSIGCLYGLLLQRWLLAGVLAALATATRPNAIALAAACAFAAAIAIRRQRDWRALAAPALAPLGLIAFFAYLAGHTGEAGAYLRTQREGWEQTLDPSSTVDAISRFVRQPFGDTNNTVLVTGTVFLAVTLVLLVRSRPPGALLVYTLAVMGMALLTPTMGPRPRFLLTAFPLVIVFSGYLKPPWFSALLATSATGLGAFTVLTVTSLLATP
jgi:hypothetical protein